MLQNLIPSFPWIAPGWRVWGRNQILPSGNLVPRFGFACGVCTDPAATRSEEVWVIGGWYVSQYLDVVEVHTVYHYMQDATLVKSSSSQISNKSNK